MIKVEIKQLGRIPNVSFLLVGAIRWILLLMFETIDNVGIIIKGDQVWSNQNIAYYIKCPLQHVGVYAQVVLII